MANFTKRPGDPGTFDPSTMTLTVHRGETVRFFLWGGGPPGQEQLVVSASGATQGAVMGEDSSGAGPGERGFRLTPAQTGEVNVTARVGTNTGPDYAAPLKIVVLTRQPSSIGPEHVIVASVGGKYEDSLDGPLKASGTSAVAFTAAGYWDFVGLLERFRDAGRRISSLEVVSHGAPGAVYFGSQALTSSSMGPLRGRGLATVFSAGARVFFHGCNVADGTEGLTFLTDFGRTLLCIGGGSVAGSTSMGFSLPGILNNGKTYHLWGNTVRVFFQPGGTVDHVDGLQPPDPPPGPIRDPLGA